MDDDVRVGLSFLQACDTADMVHMRVCAGDGLQFKAVFVDGFNDAFGIVAGIDADRALRFLAADDARVLLKGSDSDFLDDHGPISSSSCNCTNSPGPIVSMASAIRGISRLRILMRF